MTRLHFPLNFTYNVADCEKDLEEVYEEPHNVRQYRPKKDEDTELEVSSLHREKKR